MKIIPSIASANLLAIGAEIDRLGSIPYLHIDIEDGNFIASMTFGLDMVRAIAGYTKAELDVHLMVTNPLDYLEPLHACGIRRAAAHIEALPYPAKFLGKARSLGMQAGLALNLKTGVDQLAPYISQLDYVLFLTNEPDYAGLKFRDYSLNKIRQARHLLPERISIWADGGVNAALLPVLSENGVDTAIIGRAIFNSNNPEAEYHGLLSAIEE